MPNNEKVAGEMFSTSTGHHNNDDGDADADDHCCFGALYQSDKTRRSILKILHFIL